MLTFAVHFAVAYATGALTLAHLLAPIVLPGFAYCGLAMVFPGLAGCEEAR